MRMGRYVSDSCVAITVAVMLFFVPSKVPNYLCFRKSTGINDSYARINTSNVNKTKLLRP